MKLTNRPHSISRAILGIPLLLILILSIAFTHLFVAQADAAPALATDTYCQGPQTYQPTSGPTHIVNIMMENESNVAVESSPDAVFQKNTLDAQCGSFAPTAMRSTTHGSESNYIALTSGLNPALNSGADTVSRFALSDCPPLYSGTVNSVCKYSQGYIPSTTPSIYSQIETTYGTSGWKDYADSMPSNCYQSDTGQYATDSNGKSYKTYAVRHNPAVYYQGIACSTQDVPTGDFANGTGALATDLASGTMPYYSYITPNDIENGHDPSTVTGTNGVTTVVGGGKSQIGNIDTYLKTVMGLIQKSPQYQDGSLLVVITYDEGVTGGPITGENGVGEDCANVNLSVLATSCQINTWIVGRYVPHTQYSSYMNEFGILAAEQRILGLSPLLGHAADLSTPDIINGTAAIPDPFNLAPTGAATVSDAPTSVAATAGNTTASVSFTPPASTGGALITGYTATSNPGNIVSTGSSSPIVVSGLTNGTPYTFTVTANNSVGTSISSVPSTAITPVAPPAPSAPIAPTNVIATPGDTGKVSLSWSAPVISSSASAVTDYLVNYRLSTASTWTTVDENSLLTTATISGLTIGTSYDFQVVAVSSGIQGTPSTIVSATTTTVTQLLPDPGFESGNGGWVAFSIGTLSRLSSPVHGGTSVLQVASPQATSSLVGLTQNSVITNSVAGTNYTAACYVRPTSASLNVTMRFLEYTQTYSSNTNLKSISISSLPLNTWTLVQVTATALKSGERIIPQIYSTNQTSVNGNLLYDDCSVTAGNTIAAAVVPGTPTNISATAISNSAFISFTAPVSQGSSPISSYTATSGPGNFVGTGNVSPITVSGLVNGTTYIFTVTATSSAGTSVPSAASNSVTPVTVPDSATNVNATAGNTQASLSWSAPVSSGGSPITDYIVQYRQTGTTTWTSLDQQSTATSTTISGLTNGISYDFSVITVNALGQSVVSAIATATPVNPTVPVITAPGAPSVSSVVAGNGQATIAFVAPANTGGSTITGYSITSQPGGLIVSGTASPLTITGLTNGTSYTFTVTATNNIGTSVSSTPSAAVVPVAPATVPSTPTAVSATTNTTGVTVAFTAPSTNGGAAITKYTVTSTPGNVTATGTSSPISVSGLAAGVSYTFTVTATNSAGNSIASASSNAVLSASLQLLPDPGFESSTSGWIAFNVGTVTRVTSPIRTGVDALKVAATTSTANLVGLTQNSVVSNSVLGKTYTASCYVQPTAGSLNMQIRILEYTQNFSSYTNLKSASVTTLPLNTWTLMQVSGVAIKAGERIIPQIYSTNETTATGSIVYDDCSVTAN